MPGPDPDRRPHPEAPTRQMAPGESSAASGGPRPPAASPPETAGAWDLASEAFGSQQSATGPLERLGRQRIGDYVVQGELARGGIGVVYRGFHPGMEREVAIKLLRAGDRASGPQLERFATEARAAARLRHPGVVTIHHVGRLDGRANQPYLVMDLVRGEALDARIERGPLGGPDAARIARELADALAYAHGEGILHRDVKPANVLLDASTGRALLTDFGLAKDAAAPRGVTVVGQFMGSPGYASPEQVRGLVDELDPRTDVYGLGATLFHMLTGEPPFADLSSFEALAAALADPPPRPSRRRGEVDRELETICCRCLEPDPADRYPGAGALRDDLDRFLRGEPVEAARAGVVARLRKWARRRPAAARVAAGLVVALPLAAAATGVAARSRAAATALDRAERDAAAERRARREAARRGAEEARALLERVARGEAGAADRDHAVARLTLEPSLGRARLLAGRLDDLTDALLAVERDFYREALEPEPAEARAGAQRLSALPDALAAKAALGAGDELSPAAAEALAAAADRLQRRALRASRAAGARRPLATDQYVRRTLGTRQAERLGPGGLALLEVVVRALGRLGVRPPAVPALARYLHAETDDRRAAAAGRALCRLGGPRAQAVVFGALERFGPAFLHGVSGELPRLAGLPIREDDAAQLLGRARVRAARGDRDGAVMDLSRALQLDVSDPDLWAARAEHRYADGDFVGAVADFGEAAARRPGDARLWTQRARALRRTGDVEGAARDVARALEIDPQLVIAHRTRGDVLMSQGDPAAAAEAYGRAIAIDPFEAEAWFERGRARKDQEQITGAIADYERAVELDPGHAKAWRNLGSAHRKLDDHDRAIALITKAIELDPDDPLAWTYRGMARERAGDLEGAAADFGRAIEVDPYQPRAWVERSRLRLATGDLEGALEDTDEALGLAPEEAMNWCRRGDVRRAQGNERGAIDDYTRTLELSPTFASAWRGRALVRRALGDLEGARADLERSLEVAPADVEAACLLGRVLKELGDPAAALEVVDAALELDAGYAAAYTERALVLLELDRAEEALTDLDEAVARDPYLVEAWLHRAQLRRRLGRLDGARADLTRAIELAPAEPLAWGLRGLARLEAGDPSGRADLERCLELAEPGDPLRAQVREALGR